jgi:N4-gp56 family major capsid protein
MAALVRNKLVNTIKFSPLCRVDSTLAGQPGNTITLPSFAYIGDATNVAEGADIPIDTLIASTTTVTIAKAAKGLQLTDEAVLSGYGDPLSEAANQIRLAIASKVDNDILGVLGGIAAGMTYEGNMNASSVSDALVKFGEDIDGEKVILVSPDLYNVFRKDDAWVAGSDIGAEIIIGGTVGEIYGCQVVVSNKLTTSGNAYIVKPGALALYLKRDIMLETDRDIVNKSTVITADQHYVGYLYDPTKAIKMTAAE